MNFYVKKPGKKPTSDKPIVPVYELDPTNRKRNPYTKFGRNRTLRSKVIALTDTYIYIHISLNLIEDIKSTSSPGIEPGSLDCRSSALRIRLQRHTLYLCLQF